MATDAPDLQPFSAAQRPHVADGVFDQIAVAILRGDLAPGGTLPPERVLAKQFQSSRIIARQAIHRLADAGLVRVRQGGATVVLDPNESGDLRILELLYRLTPSGERGALDARQTVEKQLLQGISLVEVAARCAKPKDLERLHAMAAEALAGSLTEADYYAFEERFWRAVAKAGRNRILEMEVAWWYRVLVDPPRVVRYVPSTIGARVEFYLELARRLACGEAPLAFYVASVSPLLEGLRRYKAPRPRSRRKAP
jgi:DNA-binding FadR family transcriptional regulator